MPLFFIAEILLLLFFYLFGKQGLSVILTLKQENRQLVQEIQDIETDIGQLQKTISTWKTSSFYLEKMAREQLHMARPDDHVYRKEKQGT